MHLSATQYLTEPGKSFRYNALHRAKHNAVSDAVMAAVDNYLGSHLTLITWWTHLIHLSIIHPVQDTLCEKSEAPSQYWFNIKLQWNRRPAQCVAGPRRSCNAWGDNDLVQVANWDDGEVKMSAAFNRKCVRSEQLMLLSPRRLC